MPLELNNVVIKFIGNNFTLNLSTSLPSSGLVSIIGKSGCGKSTLLHAIGLLQPIDKGSIKLNDKEISKLHSKKKEKYLNESISYVFQNYQLLENQTILFNIALPMMIRGETEKKSLEKAKELLKKIKFPKDKYNQIVNQCSGGEKQRVAVLRSMINEPQMILADEPTGALDSKNGILVMELLKSYSKKGLVIVVTHNKELAEKYSDRIITMSEGKIIKDELINDTRTRSITFERKPKKHHSSWINTLVNTNLKKRFRRNAVSCFGVCFSLIFAFLLIGFSVGSKKVIAQESLRQFDLGVSTISIQEVQEIEGSKLSLVQQSRLSNSEIMDFISSNDNFTYGLNYSYLVPEYLEVKIDNEMMKEFSYHPIYSFKGSYCPNLLKEGRLAKDNLNEVVVNQKLKENYYQLTKENILEKEINVGFTKETTIYFDDENTPYVTDYFAYDVKAKVVGVVDELSFLNTPKIYYSYKALDSYLDTFIMSNLSNYLGETITYKDRVDQSSPKSELSSYSYNIFLNNFDDFEAIVNYKNDKYVISNSAKVIKEALNSFVDATTMGMEVFLAITAIGSVLILGITSFSSFSQDKHENAILMSLGTNRDSLFQVYIIENLFIGVIAFLLSLVLSFACSPLFNNVIFNFTGFGNMIQIPFNSFMNYRFFLPIIVFGITLFTSFLSCYMPLSLGGKINISRELKEE